MSSQFGIRGRCQVKIEKADGRIFTQEVDNRLVDNVAHQLGDRIFSNSGAYSASYQPKKLKVIIKGYGGSAGSNNLTLWASNALTADISIGEEIAALQTSLYATYSDLVFDGDTSNFPSPYHEADGETSQIYGVQLLADDGTTVIGQALFGDTGSAYDDDKFGKGFLHGDVGPGESGANVIDNNDKVTVTYHVFFMSSPVDNVVTGDLDRTNGSVLGTDAYSHMQYLRNLRNTVRDAPQASGTPNISLASATVYWVDGTDEQSKDAPTPLDLDTFDSTSNVLTNFTAGTGDRGRGTWIYFGDPDVETTEHYTNPGSDPDIVAIADASGLTKTVKDTADFQQIPAAARPTRVTLKSGGGDVIYSFGITSTDISSWTNGDNIAFSFYMYVSVNYGTTYEGVDGSGDAVNNSDQETSPSDPLDYSAA